MPHEDGVPRTRFFHKAFFVDSDMRERFSAVWQQARDGLLADWEQSAEGVLALLDKLVRGSGHTMLIATHSQHVASHCDRVLELHNGKLEPAA